MRDYWRKLKEDLIDEHYLAIEFFLAINTITFIALGILVLLGILSGQGR